MNLRWRLAAVQWLLLSSCLSEASRLRATNFVLSSEIEHHSSRGEMRTRIELQEHYSHEQSRGLVSITAHANGTSGEFTRRGMYWIDREEELLLFQDMGHTHDKCVQVNPVQVWSAIGLDYLDVPDDGLYIGTARLLDHLADLLQGESISERTNSQELDRFARVRALASDWSRMDLAGDKPLPRVITFAAQDGRSTAVTIKILERANSVSGGVSLDSLAIEPLSSCSLLLAESSRPHLGRSSPFMRRVVSHRPIEQFTFEAAVRSTESAVEEVKAKVIYDARLQKLRANFATRQQTVSQLFDLKHAIAFHKLTVGAKRISRNSCGASLIPDDGLTVGRLLMGSDQGQYLGLASIGEGQQVRLYQSIGGGLPYWLDPQLAPKQRVMGDRVFLTLLYFSVSNGTDDRLLKAEVMRIVDVDRRALADRREITFEHFEWSLGHALSEDPSELFSLAGECFQGEVRRVSLELRGKVAGQDWSETRTRNRALLVGLQADLSLPTGRILDLASNATRIDPDRLELALEFDVSAAPAMVGTFRPAMDNDQALEPTGCAKSIENTMSFGQCYFFASQQQVEQVFFAYEADKRTCRLSNRLEAGWRLLNNAAPGVCTMRKVPNQYGSRLETWTPEGVGRWLSLSTNSTSSSFAITKLAIDGEVIREQAANSSTHEAAHGQPVLVAIRTSDWLSFVLASLTLTALVALTMLVLNQRARARKAATSNKQAGIFSPNSAIQLDEVAAS